jgi:hypothetical protein
MSERWALIGSMWCSNCECRHPVYEVNECCEIIVCDECGYDTTDAIDNGWATDFKKNNFAFPEVAGIYSYQMTGL